MLPGLYNTRHQLIWSACKTNSCLMRVAHCLNWTWLFSCYCYKLHEFLMASQMQQQAKHCTRCVLHPWHMSVRGACDHMQGSDAFCMDEMELLTFRLFLRLYVYEPGQLTFRPVPRMPRHVPHQIGKALKALHLIETEGQTYLHCLPFACFRVSHA